MATTEVLSPRPARLRLATDVALSTTWLALIAGAAEGLFWLVQQQVAGKLVFMHPGFFWMSPLTLLVLFAVPGGVLAAVAARSARSGVLPFTVTLLSLIGWLNLMLLVPGLHFAASLVLACGLATATGRWSRRHTDRFVLVVRRSLAWLIAAIVLVALLQTGMAARREASAIRALPEAPHRAPNILLVVIDAVRADALAPYGADRGVAPNLARLAEQGVVFERAWATAPWTLPSQAGMFTGRMPHELSADWLSRLDDAHRTLAEELSARGWVTGGFVGNTRYCSAETGLARGFTHYEGYRLSWADFALTTALGRRLLLSSLPVRLGFRDWPGRKRAPEVSHGLTHWLARRGQRPYFAFLNYWDAHDPYFAPSGFQTEVPGDLNETLLLRNWWWIEKEDLTENQIEMVRGAYEDCIRGLDAQLGRLFEELRREGELENTLVIVTADHGEHFAEHDLFLHGNSLYEPLLHVPLIVVWPDKVPAGRTVTTPVSLAGLPNTVMELLGEEKSFPGESWVRHWEGEGPQKESAPVVAQIASQAGFPPCHGRSPVARGPMQALRKGNLKYIRNGDGTEELYDLARDPREEQNLIGDPNHEAAAQRMRSAGGGLAKQ